MIGSIFLIASYMIYARVGLIADGSFFLVREISKKAVCDGGWPSRYFSDFVTQLPVLLAIETPLKKLRILTYFQSIGLIIIPSIIWTLALLRTYRRPIFVAIYCLYCTSFLNNIIYPISETNISIAIFVCIAVWLITIPIKKFTDKSIIIFLSFLSVASYSSTLITGPILLYALYCNARDFAGCHSARSFLQFLTAEKWASVSTVLFIFSGVIGAISTFDPSSTNELKGSFSFVVLIHSYQAIFTCIGATIFIMSMVVRDYDYFINKLLKILSFLILLYFIVNIEKFENNIQSYFGTKSILCLYSSFIVLILIIWRFSMRAVKYSISWAGLIMPLLLFLSTAIPAVQNAEQFVVFTNHIRHIADRSTGIVDIAHTTLPRYRGYYWTYPFLSIIVANRPNSAVILDKKLYNISINRSNFPDLNSYY